MAFVQQSFSASATIGILIDGLVSGAYAESTMLNSTTTGAISALIEVNFTLGATVNPGDYVGVYIARSLDGVIYDDVGNNLQALASFSEFNAGTQQFFTIDTAIVGTLPPYWKFVIFNGTVSDFEMGSGASLTWKTLKDN